MDSILTQGLIGLVFVLSVALWSKSSTSTITTSSKGLSSSEQQKSKKKKKKGNALPSAPDLAAASNQKAVLHNKIELPPSEVAEKALQEVKKPVKPSKVVTSNGSQKVSATQSKKKMTLEDFVAKTNEERVEELEREARGSAGEKDVGGDMIDKDLQPEIPYKKVARIEPIASRTIHTSIPAEDGWESVGGKSKIVPSIASSKPSNVVPVNAWASSNPFALLPGSGAELQRASEPNLTKTASTSTSSFATKDSPQTKKQRQNAAKTQAKKAEKEVMEAERLARLAQHKKQVEAERMKDYFKKQPSASNAPFSTHFNGTSKSSSNLPKASVNEKGSLVWD